MNDFTEIATMEDINNQSRDIINGMNNTNSMVYCSFQPETPEEKKILFNASSTSDAKAFMDCNGNVINIRDVIIMPNQMTNEDGTTAVVPRIVVITTEGEVYSAASWGLYKALARLNALMGTLHFDEGLPAKIKVIKTKRGKTINLELV